MAIAFPTTTESTFPEAQDFIPGLRFNVDYKLRFTCKQTPKQNKVKQSVNSLIVVNLVHVWDLVDAVALLVLKNNIICLPSKLPVWIKRNGRGVCSLLKLCY